MPFKFEKLEIWQQALDLSNKIDQLTKSFPVDERFSLTQQMKRAADSVVLNIAEGCTGQTDPELKRFLGMSLRSALEVVACLFLAKTRNYCSEDNFTLLYNDYEVLCKKITRFRENA